ncbi:MAG: phosphotransferase [Candidatus Limnocylindria bacterium]
MDARDPATLPWHDLAWLAAARRWIEGVVAREGWDLSGPIEQPHAVWWSTVLRVPTADGPLWFKASQPDGAVEIRLTSMLAAIRPEAIARIVASDAGRGWMLSQDAGTRLREIGGERSAVDRWADLLPSYAELQIELAFRREALFELGVPDHGLGVLPAELRATLDEPDTILLGQANGLTSVQREHLVGDLPAFGELCARLAAFGIPETLQHDDLHDGNVGVHDDGYVLFDWGDSCISHPFHTLAVTLRALAHRHGWAPGGVEITRLRDAYLEPWQSFAPQRELVEVADLARRTGTIQRSLAWRRMTRDMPPGIRAEHVDTVAYGLRLYLRDGPWGSWDDGSPE